MSSRGSFSLFVHDRGNELVLVLLDAWMCILVHQIRLRVLHPNLLQVVVEQLVAIPLSNDQLMRVPILREDLLDVMLVHAKVHEVDLGARLAEERAIRDVGMRRLPLIAVDAVGIELVVRDQSHHQCSQLLCLGLLERATRGRLSK